MSVAEPEVSVIVLTWNRLELLKETVTGVLAQTHDDFELLIVDNESEDGTEAWVASQDDPRIRYLRHGNGGSIAVNRNHGVDHANGEWVAFCDDDDTWERSKLRRQLEVARADPGCVMVSTDALVVRDGIESGTMARDSRSREVTLDELLRGVLDVFISSVLVRTEVLRTTGRFSEDPATFSVEDYDMWVRVARHGRIRFLGEPLVRYVVHGGMASHADFRDVLAKERIMFRRLRDQGVVGEAEYRRALRNIRAQHAFSTLKQTLKRSSLARDTYYRYRRVAKRPRA
jgi:glycosyltransferase involved in cell wall biosynthesis